MAGSPHRQLQIQAIVSGVFGLAGLVIFLTTRTPPPIEDFWAPYITALGGTGALLCMFGFAWLILTLAQLYTHLFSEGHPIDSSQFGAVLAGTAVGVVVLMMLVLPKVPNTPPSRLPSETEARTALVRQEENFRSLVTVFILMTGVAVVYIPARRFFSK